MALVGCVGVGRDVVGGAEWGENADVVGVCGGFGVCVVAVCGDLAGESASCGSVFVVGCGGVCVGWCDVVGEDGGEGEVAGMGGVAGVVGVGYGDASLCGCVGE